MLTYSCHFKLFEISLMLMGARLSDLKSVLLHHAAADVPLCGPSVAIPGQLKLCISSDFFCHWCQAFSKDSS